MAKDVMSPLEYITAQQIGKFQELLAAQLRKSRIPKELAQAALEEKGGESLRVALLGTIRDTIYGTLHVDRSIPEIYSDWARPMHPDLEQLGPSEYTIADLRRWHHPEQLGGFVRGERIYEYLLQSGLLKHCLTLADLRAMQEMKIADLARHFPAWSFPYPSGLYGVFAWRSVVQQKSDGSLRVPYLTRHESKMLLEWKFVGDGFMEKHLTLCFNK